LERLLERALAVILAGITVLVLLQVVARYGFGRPPSWTEELARYLQVWLVMLAAPVCLRRGMHLAVDYLSPRLDPRGAAHATARLLVLGSVAAFAGVLAWFGIALLAVSAVQRSPALGISMVWAYAAVPLSGALMFGEAVRSIAALISSRNADPEPR
jgi:TRAP-type C4-dicarboxylate transport system permease small subunit